MSNENISVDRLKEIFAQADRDPFFGNQKQQTWEQISLFDNSEILTETSNVKSDGKKQ